MKPLADCKLYTFVDTAYLHGRAPELIAQQLCDGGSDLIQLRAKKSSPEEILRMAEKIIPITKRANVGLVINDHLEMRANLAWNFAIWDRKTFSPPVSKTFLNSKLKTQNSKLDYPHIRRSKPNAL